MARAVDANVRPRPNRIGGCIRFARTANHESFFKELLTCNSSPRPGVTGFYAIQALEVPATAPCPEPLAFLDEVVVIPCVSKLGMRPARVPSIGLGVTRSMSGSRSVGLALEVSPTGRCSGKHVANSVLERLSVE